jgi:hypothetical protein
MLVSYPLEPQPKDCVDTPEGNLESGPVVPRQMEERIASADQRFFDRATSQHVYIPWLADTRNFLPKVPSPSS